MDERPYKPIESPGLIPHLTVKNADQAIHFYREMFMFELVKQPIRFNGEIMHAELKLYDARITLAPEGAWGMTKQTPASQNIQSPIGFYVYVKDVETFYKHAQTQGAEILFGPTDMFWGDRVCCFKDKDGYDWSFATNVADFDPKKIPKVEKE